MTDQELYAKINAVLPFTVGRRECLGELVRIAKEYAAGQAVPQPQPQSLPTVKECLEAIGLHKPA